MEKCLSEAVEVLAEDEMVLKSRVKLGNKLGISGAKIQQIMNSYTQGVTTNYELMDRILKEWMQLADDSATVAELRRILCENGFRRCSGNLAKFDETDECILSTEASSSTGAANSVFVPRPFGFQEVVDNFSGREKELDTLTKYFNSGKYRIVLLSGLGGIGKTQLATKFALSVKSTNDSPVVKSWLSGESSQTLHQSTATFYRHLQLPTTADKNQTELEQMLKNIFEKLQMKRWLVVIDNVDEMYDEFKTAAKTLRRFGTQVFLLVTSRRRDIFPGQLKHFPLQVLDERSSVELIKVSLEIKENSDNKFITELCQNLENFPLALSQAAAYILQQKAMSLKGDQYSIQDYLIELAEQETTGLDQDRELADYPMATIKVWNMTLNKIESAYGLNGEIAVNAISVIAFISPEYFELKLVHRLYKIFYNTEIAWSAFENCLQILVKYSLINPSVSNSCYETLNIHKLVQLAVRKRIATHNKETEILAQFWTSLQTNELDCHSGRHLLSIWKHTSRLQDLDKIRASRAISLLHFFMNPLWPNEEALSEFIHECAQLLPRFYEAESAECVLMDRGSAILMVPKKQYTLSLEKLTVAYDKLKVLLGEYHAETLATSGWIAFVLQLLGRNEESLKWCQDLLTVFSTIPVVDDEIIIKTKYRLGSTFDLLGKWKEAVQCLKQVLEWQRIRLGEADQDTFNTGGYIAQILSENGEFSEARELFQEQISLQEKFNGVNFWRTVSAKIDFVDFLKNMGEDAEAVKLMEELLVKADSVHVPEDYAQKITRLKQKLAACD